MNITKNNLYRLALFIYSLVFIVASWNIFPEKWKYDSYFILDIIENKNLIDYDFDSFHSVALLYKLFLVDIIPWEFSVLAANFLLLYLIMRGEVIDFNKFIFIIIFLPYTLIYTSFISKEIALAFLFIFIATFNNFSYRLVLIFSYGIFFRTYWIIILLNYLITSLLNIVKFYKIFIFNLIIIVCYFIIYNLISENNISSIRDGLTLFRINSEASESLILNLNYFGVGVINDITNYFHAIILLLFPVFYLKQSLFYFIYSLYFYFLLINFYIFVYYNKNNKNVVSFVLIYFLVLAIFEPDFGSFSRHFSLISLFVMKEALKS